MAGFVVALRFFEIFIGVNDVIIQTMLYVTVVLTMTIPNLIALQQKILKECLRIHQSLMQDLQWERL